MSKKQNIYNCYIAYDHDNRQLASFEDIYCIVYGKKNYVTDHLT